ncbi:MAG: hypothetical protein AB7G44_15460 [Bacteroidia bacterium]
MESILVLLMLVNLIMLVIGFISPQLSLFWYKGKRTRKKSAELYGLFLTTFIIIFGLLVTA